MTSPDSPKRNRLRQLVLYGLLAVGIVLVAVVVDNQNTQAPRWTVPYFSGAANFRLGAGWRYDPAEVERFRELPTPEARQQYRFQPAPEENLESFHYSPRGYLYVVLIARNLFFWQGDLQSAESLQLLVHILMTFWLLGRIGRPSGRVAFYVLYGLNPLVIYCTTTPYYYFWAAIPTALLSGYLLDKQFQFGRLLIPVAAAVGWAYAIRPTCLFVCLAFLGLAVIRESKPLSVLAVVAFLAFAALLGGRSFKQRPWHTMYVGVGAYPNPYIESFTDEKGYEFFTQQTGDYIDGGSLLDEEFYERYSTIVRGEFLKIARERPLMLLRNALLNYFQSFSVGYITASLKLSYASALTGFCFLLLLLWRKKYLFVIAATLSAIPVVPYFPPIPAYLFGSYVLLVAALVDIIVEWQWPRDRLARRFAHSGGAE